MTVVLAKSTAINAYVVLQTQGVLKYLLHLMLTCYYCADVGLGEKQELLSAQQILNFSRFISRYQSLRSSYKKHFEEVSQV